jgi:transposase InsO family protein
MKHAETMPTPKPPKISLPKAWPCHVKSAVVHIISLAHFSITYARGWAANSINAKVRIAAENDRLHQEIALLREELRIKDSRMCGIAAHRRPRYTPTERLAILEVRAARGWSLKQTADVFLVTPTTVASWSKRVDELGPKALLQLPEPVNRFPDFVRYAVQRLKTLCPTMGKVKIAQTLARAGLHLSVSTVGRMLKEPPPPLPKQVDVSTGRVVTAKRPNHVWHLDLTTVSTVSGFWASWLPFVLPQSWPFCWWVAVVIDHYSRRLITVAVFSQKPDSVAVCRFLGSVDSTPNYLVCDKDKVFWCHQFKDWCRRKGIRLRFGAVGKHGSIAVVERVIKTVKDEHTRRIVVPQRGQEFRRELLSFLDWYNEHRPHMTLDGSTPNEVYFGQRPANLRPRVEPRKRWPRGSLCANPHTLVAGQPGDCFSLEVNYHNGRRHLPVVSLRRAA